MHMFLFPSHGNSLSGRAKTQKSSLCASSQLFICSNRCLFAMAVAGFLDVYLICSPSVVDTNSPCSVQENQLAAAFFDWPIILPIIIISIIISIINIVRLMSQENLNVIFLLVVGFDLLLFLVLLLFAAELFPLAVDKHREVEAYQLTTREMATHCKRVENRFIFLDSFGISTKL